MHLSSRVKKISASLTLSITAKSKKMKAEGVDVVSFGSGEPDFDTPSYIKEAAIKAIQEGFTKYTPASGTDELKKIICEKFYKDNNLKYDPSEIVVSCGAKHSLYNIFQAICDQDDEVLIPAPYWLSYPEMVRLAGARPIIIETDEESNFKISPAKLNNSVTKKTKALILNSPSNPTGCVYNKDELAKIAEIALKHNILVISDEIYEKIIFEGRKHVSIATIDENIFKNTIVVNGVSKSFSMTGWRIGYLASCNGELMTAIKNLQSHSTSNPASISQAAALKALRERDDSVREMVTQFQARRDYIVERIGNIKGLSCVKPEGAFYVFCRIDKKGLSSMQVAERLLEEVKVAVIPGKAFGSDRHIRLSFATSMDNIKKGMDRLEEWFEGI
ncbi:MAG: pyridoxal phosphate-dependent aminotransferase [Candidatus Omnitrophica bacterium]|nr:pyridoxal phosphate-dependent aminotransferase [Candidatus Omnitrophota bacterium]